MRPSASSCVGLRRWIPKQASSSRLTASSPDCSSGGSLIQDIPALAAAIGLIGVLVSLLLALISFTNREYRLAPSFAASVRLMAAPREWLEWRFLGNLEEAFQVNKRRLVRKAGFLTSSMIVLMTTLMVLGGYAVPTVVGGS